MMKLEPNYSHWKYILLDITNHVHPSPRRVHA